jgi:predicted secreted protein
MSLQKFDLQTSKVVRDVYDEVLAGIDRRAPDLTERHRALIKTRLVSTLISAADKGVKDPVKLRARAIETIGNPHNWR